MAPLEVICASFGRSGTDSLRTALNKLGYNTHHMRTMFMNLENCHSELFTEAYKHPERPTDWDLIYKDYNAACDWPTASFIKPLMSKYPNAKILMIVRDPDSWYRSVKNTIFKHNNLIAADGDENKKKLSEMINTTVLDGAFGNPELFNDEQVIKQKFVDHIEWVKKNVPEDNLLIMELGEGWDRLCQFLGKPVPNEPYPHTNTTADMAKTFDRLDNGDQISDIANTSVSS
ncbi:P-loop containing nucleoside triphosphate hydrolase protein [Circinella umbellata]|nr:P-loop containing nucleoside triphosphate hydrolase protein [Circinella umbellata]